MRFVVFLVEEGHLTANQGIAVLQVMCRRTPPLGRLIVRDKLMSLSDLRALLAEQRDSGLPLGKLAVQKGYLTREGVRELLNRQRQETPLGRELVLELGLMDASAIEEAHQRFISLLS